MSSEHELLVISCGRVAALAFLIHEILITLDDEVNVIWSKPHSSWIKWQFLFTRYFALAAQLVNTSLDRAITEHAVIHSRSLKHWYITQVVVGGILMLAVEFVLMARVYALYSKHVWIRVGFLTLILSEIVTMVIGIVVTDPGEEFKLETFLLTSPHAYTYFGTAAAISQLAILMLTLIKYKAARRSGWGNVPIMILMVRDGTAAFFILLVVTTMTVVATAMENEYAPIGNSWFLSVVACAGCRLIINMQNLPAGRSEMESTDFPTTVQLTTFLHDFQIDSEPEGNTTESEINRC